jgi:hypothetical protein
MPLGLGSAFENGTDRYGDLEQHLWIIVSEPDASGQVILVNLTTWAGKSDDDPACIINKGEHEFVHHKTYVSYIDTRFASIKQLESLARQKWLTMYPDASKVLLKKIWGGAEKSIHTKGKYLSLLRSQGCI